MWCVCASLTFCSRFLAIKFRYNARSDWLKERALLEYRARSVEGRPISVFASAFWRIWPKNKRPLTQKNAKNTSYLSAINMNCTEAIVNNSSVKTVHKLQALLSLHDENTTIK